MGLAPHARLEFPMTTTIPLCVLDDIALRVWGVPLKSAGAASQSFARATGVSSHSMGTVRVEGCGLAGGWNAHR